MNQTYTKGVAISFFTEEDAPLAKSLVSIMEKSGQEPPEELLAMRNAPTPQSLVAIVLGRVKIQASKLSFLGQKLQD